MHQFFRKDTVFICTFYNLGLSYRNGICRIKKLQIPLENKFIIPFIDEMCLLNFPIKRFVVKCDKMPVG